MNYTNESYMVRVDRFRRENGKWYDTLAVNMKKFWTEPTPIHTVAKSINAHIGLSDDFIYVCMDPFHINAYPVCLINWDDLLLKDDSHIPAAGYGMEEM